MVRCARVQAFALMIEEEYRVNLLLDNLPIAMPVFMTEETPEGQSTGNNFLCPYVLSARACACMRPCVRPCVWGRMRGQARAPPE